MKEHSEHVVRTADVIGKSVVDKDKENIGKIEEIVLDKVSGQTRYAVLSFGGFMGMGSDYYAIPWKTLSYSPEEDAFTVNIDKDKLKSASGFDKDNWPDFANTSWSTSIDKYYDINY
ncbi:MAG: PRC-barrel domain-containing protein [Neisseriaceae bacterium]